MVALAEIVPEKILDRPHRRDWLELAWSGAQSDGENTPALEILRHEESLSLTPDVELVYNQQSYQLSGKNIITGDTCLFTDRETEVLILLLQSANTIVHHTRLCQRYVELMDEMYTNGQYQNTLGVIRAHIKNIRTKLTDVGIPREVLQSVLVTRSRNGYCLQLEATFGQVQPRTEIIQGLWLDHSTYDLVWQEECKLLLTPIAYAILTLLTDHRGKTVSFDTFFSFLWSVSTTMTPRSRELCKDNLVTQISGLRRAVRKLTQEQADLPIENVSGLGYILE